MTSFCLVSFETNMKTLYQHPITRWVRADMVFFSPRYHDEAVQLVPGFLHFDTMFNLQHYYSHIMPNQVHNHPLDKFG